MTVAYFYENLLMGALINIIMFGLGLMASKTILMFMDIRPMRRVISFSSGGKINIITSCIDYKDTIINEFTGMGFKSDILSASSVLLTLKKIYKKIEPTIYLECDNTYNLKNNIVVIGGVKYNNLISRVFRMSTFRFIWTIILL